MTEEEQNWYRTFINASDEEAKKMFDSMAPLVSYDQYWYTRKNVEKRARPLGLKHG